MARQVADRRLGPGRPLRPGARLFPDYSAGRAEHLHLYDFAPVMYFLLDDRGVISDANHMCMQALRASQSQLRSVALREYVVASDRKAFLDYLRKCRTGADVVETEVVLRALDGGRIPVALYGRRAVLDGVRVFPTIAVDQTDRRALERAREAAERDRDVAEEQRRAAEASEAAKDQLIAMVSHELRNPLNPALVAAHQLGAFAASPERVKHLAGIIKRNIELEARLIDDLLDVARIARSGLELQLDQVNVHRALGEAVSAVAPAAAAKSITLTLELTATAHHALADKARLRQVFWNVLNNAIKFSDRNGRVVVRTTNLRGKLRTTVTDDGIGIDAATLGRLFVPFSETPERRRERGGLGVGLSIAHGIMRSHGGSLAARSGGRGQGATFEIELATRLASKRSSGRAQPRVPPPQPPARLFTSMTPETGRRVLIVEDDPDTGTVLSMFLSERGYLTTLAQSLSDGLAAVGRGWDAIVSDIALSDGSGLEIAKAARALARAPEALIALSGHGSRTDVATSRDAGFHTHLVKPIDLDALVRVLPRPA